MVEREYFGHDQLLTLHLDDGRRLLARTGPIPSVQPGDRVVIAITEVVAYRRRGAERI